MEKLGSITPLPPVTLWTPNGDIVVKSEVMSLNPDSPNYQRYAYPLTAVQKQYNPHDYKMGAHYKKLTNAHKAELGLIKSMGWYTTNGAALKHLVTLLTVPKQNKDPYVSPILGSTPITHKSRGGTASKDKRNRPINPYASNHGLVVNIRGEELVLDTAEQRKYEEFTKGKDGVLLEVAQDLFMAWREELQPLRYYKPLTTAYKKQILREFNREMVETVECEYKGGWLQEVGEE